MSGIRTAALAACASVLPCVAMLIPWSLITVVIFLRTFAKYPRVPTFDDVLGFAMVGTYAFIALAAPMWALYAVGLRRIRRPAKLVLSTGLALSAFFAVGSLLFMWCLNIFSS